MHIDAADVLVSCSPEKILNRFLNEFDCDALFNCEKISSPGSHKGKNSLIPNALLNVSTGDRQSAMDWFGGMGLSPEDTEKLHRIEEFERRHSKTPFCHLNTGCYIGRRKYIIELLKEAISMEGFIPTSPFHTYDQVLMREVQRSHYPHLQVDTECKIFQCMFLIDQEEVQCSFPLGGLRENAMHTWHRLLPYRQSTRIYRKAVGLTKEQYRNCWGLLTPKEEKRAA
ncbi:MAG: glycosyltransferase domain-containing protein [Pirellulales bacterium]